MTILLSLCAPLKINVNVEFLCGNYYDFADDARANKTDFLWKIGTTLPED